MMTLIGMVANAQETSVAGFYPLKGSGRIVYNFNPGWRFHLGDVAHGEATTLDDSRWEVVSAPHTSRLEPAEVSGSRNYQGISWYRKTFTMPDEMGEKQVELHFEAIMGKQQVYVNGRLVTENKGGYLPIICEDLEKGELRILKDSEFDMGERKKRHGGVIPVTDEEYDRLVRAFGIGGSPNRG